MGKTLIVGGTVALPGDSNLDGVTTDGVCAFDFKNVRSNWLASIAAELSRYCVMIVSQMRLASSIRFFSCKMCTCSINAIGALKLPALADAICW